jgi:hypothetical protein
MSTDCCNRDGLPRNREPIVHATLDLALQREIAGLVENLWPEWQEAGAEQVAVLVVERAGFAVRAALGSRDYFHSPAGALDFVRIPRSPGSTLKPFLYALALERKVLTPATWLPDGPEGAAGIGNADGRFLGPLRPRQALANSRNVPAIHLLRRVGLDSFFDLLGELALVPGAQRRDPGRFGLALALGGLPTTLERLVRAYGALVDDGRLPALQWYEGQPLPAPHPVLSPAAARQVTLFLADPLARLPSFPRYGPTDYPFPVALKTGTSQGYRDAWIVAYSPDYLVGVWVGRSDVDPMRGLTGGRAPATLARAILLYLHQSRPGDLRDNDSFPSPEGYLPVEICLHFIRLPNRCAQTLREWVPPALSADLPPPTPLPSREGSGETRDFDDETPIEIVIVAPEQSARLWRNPEAPAAVNRIALKAVARGPVSQIVWYVDDEPFGIAGADEPLYWPLRKGTHQFQVRLPYRAERYAQLHPVGSFFWSGAGRPAADGAATGSAHPGSGAVSCRPGLVALAWSLLAPFDRTTAAMQFVEQVVWSSSIGVSYALGLDGISLPMVLLATLLVAVALLASDSVKTQVKGYHAWLLILEFAMLGVFMAQDWSLFFMFWELTLIPLFFLIDLWGGEKRHVASLNFVLYTMGGAIFILIGIIMVYRLTPTQSFAMAAMAQAAATLPRQEQMWLLLAFLIGFGVKIPIFPLHGWLPLAHVEAPSPVSILLSGVLLKMGAYGLLRVVGCCRKGLWRYNRCWSGSRWSASSTAGCWRGGKAI